MISIVLRDANLRNALMFYTITNAISYLMVFIDVYYLETPWADDGLGLTSSSISWLFLIVTFPSIVAIMLTPFIVPRRIKKFAFMRFVVVVQILSFAILPLLRDLFGSQAGTVRYVALAALGLNMFFNCNLTNPFLNYYLNKYVTASGRTAMNALTVITSLLA